VKIVCRGRCCEAAAAADAVEIEVVVVVELLPPVLWLDAYAEAEVQRPDASSVLREEQMHVPVRWRFRCMSRKGVRWF